MMGIFEPYRGKTIEVLDPLGMARHREWWALRGDALGWEPISTYCKEDYETVVLRAVDGRWTYGCRREGLWHRFTEGAAWPLPADFEPIEWAPVNVDDAIELGQD
jgi:hypothetical protein